MKELCITHSAFNKIIGYGSWVIITSFLVLSVIFTYLENESIYQVVKDYDGFYGWYHCYNQFFSQSESCVNIARGIDSLFQARFYLSVILNVINLVVIGLWVYAKQQTFKFKFCEQKNEDREIKS